MTPDAAELQRRARKRLPPSVYDYYAGGSGRERTLRASEKAWRRVWMAPRVLREVSSVGTGTRLLGRTFATPVCVAPTADTPVVGRKRRCGGGEECEIYADGGIRTGEDVLAALALGARAVFLGRPVMWALACGGAEGVRSLLAGLTDDLAHAMTLAGAASVVETGGIAQTGDAGWPPR